MGHAGLPPPRECVWKRFSALAQTPLLRARAQQNLCTEMMHWRLRHPITRVGLDGFP
jgi:hypothetical protein